MKAILATLVIIMSIGKGVYAKDAVDNIKFSGTLVALPCNISISDQEIRVYMGVINAHDLYSNLPVRRIPFTLHLEDCDTKIANTVDVTFRGLESSGGFFGY